MTTKAKVDKPESLVCPRCSSAHTVKHGFHVLVGGNKPQRYKCQECGHTFYDNNKEQKA